MAFQKRYTRPARTAVAPDIATAERHLQATEFGLAPTSQVNLGFMVGYDGAAIAEIPGLLDRQVEDVLVPLAARR